MLFGFIEFSLLIFVITLGKLTGMGIVSYSLVFKMSNLSFFLSSMI